jgi:hypothetical protein
VTVTATAAPDPDDWHDTFGRQRAHDAAMRLAAAAAANADNVDPATMDEFDRIVAEREQWYRDHPGAEAPPWPNPLTPYLVDWVEFWAADHDDTEWLLEPLFADGRAHALYAGAKTGKSYLILAACAALATGRPFLGHPGGEPVHVLYVDYEMTPQDVRERLVEFGYGPDDDLSHLHYALLPSLPPLDSEEGGQALLESALAVRAVFVVVDTTSRAIQGDENDADTMRAFYRCTGLKLKQQGIGWMRLDHAGKDATKGQRGSSAKNDDVDVVVRIERTDGGQRWIATHRRMAWYHELVEIAVTPGDDGVTTFTMPEAVMWPEGTSRLAADLDRIGVPLEASVRLARDYMKDHPDVAGRNDKVSAALKWRRVEASRLADEAAERLSETIRNRPSQVGEHAGERVSESDGEQFPANRGTPLKTNGERLGERRGTVSDADGEHTANHVGVRRVPSVPADPPDELTDEPGEDIF